MLPGECCGCHKAPTPRIRFNVIVEDRSSAQTFTQLLCEECATSLFRQLIGQSVEKTPQAELDEVRIHITDAKQPLQGQPTSGVA